MTSFAVGPHSEIEASWPREGHHVIATHTEDTIVLYQAFNDAIADYAVKNGVFGGPAFSFERMSWVKPNFLWMMYRSGWATKHNQTRILALHISKENFFLILQRARVNSCGGSKFKHHGLSAARDAAETEQAVPDASPDATAVRRPGDSSRVVVQWDPDHHPNGAPCARRRAIQIGIRGDLLRRFATEFLLHVEDVTPFVVAQRSAAVAPYAELLVPRESVVPLPRSLAQHILPDDA